MNDIEAQVCADILTRQRRGLAKYGQTVAQNPAELREWLTHAYEECLDMAVYLKRAMEELPSKPEVAEMVILEAQASMTSDQRKELWRRLSMDYCEYCGGDNLPCFCHPSYDD